MRTLLLSLIIWIAGCARESPRAAEAGGKRPEPAAPAAASLATETPPPYIATGDWNDIQARGWIRILVPAEREKLQRDGDPDVAEQAFVLRVNQKLGVKTQFIEGSTLAQMFDDLDAGRADLIAASLAITPERAARLAFTRPIRYVKQQLIAKAGAPKITQIEDLDGKEITVLAGSSYQSTLEQAQKRAPNLKITPVFEDEYQLIARVSRGEIAYTVVDSGIATDALTFEDGVAVVFDLTDKDPIGWALRKANPALKAVLDSHAQELLLTAHQDKEYKVDLDGIQENKVLRVLTRNSSSTYFIYRGEPLGFEYELMKDFCNTLGVRLEIIIPPSRESLATYLRQGRGDVVAAGLSVTEDRKREFAFSEPYNKVSEVVVVPASDETLQTVDDLNGRPISVRRSSSYFQTLTKISDKFGFIVSTVGEDLETEEILAQVGARKLAATVADSNIVDVELTYNSQIRPLGPLGDPADIGWMVRKDQPKLKEALDAYIRKTYRGVFYNVLVNKYFKNPKIPKKAAGKDRGDREGRISPYDEIVKKYAAQYEFDWRLLAAQMFQESRFDPNARSWVGALGLMQVMPATAMELKIADLPVPENGIRAGVELMARYAKVFADPKIQEKDRIRFALAAYNCGAGHVQDARRIAAAADLDPDKWFGAVEKAMRLLSKPQWAGKVRYGYCRCNEPVRYVSEIQTRYGSYAEVVAAE